MIVLYVMHMPKYGAGGYKGLSATELIDKLEARKRRLKESGKTLRYLRKKANLSQREIAERLNIVQQTYAGYENGHHEPSIDILIQLADFHKVTLDYISGRIFDDWIPEPFSHMKTEEQAHIDLLEHAQRQHKDVDEFSFMVMEARIHGEYDPDEERPSSQHRKLIDYILDRTKS